MVDEEKTKGRWSKAWIFGLIAILAAVIVVIVLVCVDNRGMSVADFLEQTEQKINRELSEPDHSFRLYVENAHKTVKVHTAYVSDLKVTTKDGSKHIGAGGKNIRRIYVEITTRWDGMVHKNGYTVVGVDVENINGERKVTNARIVRSDAVVNTEDPKFWYRVGIIVAALLL